VWSADAAAALGRVAAPRGAGLPVPARCAARCQGAAALTRRPLPRTHTSLHISSPRRAPAHLAVSPAPLQELGVEPARCVVIEDSRIGLAAAKAAGMR
jgi:hypothetical protein